MPRKRQSVSETINWLSFPRQRYPDFYLNKERIGRRFHSYLGSIREFSESVHKSTEVNAAVKAVFAQAGIKRGGGKDGEIAWDLTNSIAQVLVLRAYLATAGDLDTDAHSAGVTDWVLARGQGGIIKPLDVADSPLWDKVGISPDVVTEIAVEQQRQAAMENSADSVPLHWATYANTDQGLVVSLLKDASVVKDDMQSYAGVPMTYCIFGQKIRDWPAWALLSPLHVWIEPPGNANWG